LDLVQEFGPDLDLDMGEVALNDLQGKLERLAVAVIHHLAEQRVPEVGGVSKSGGMEARRGGPS
jgi:hypothetical protein